MANKSNPGMFRCYEAALPDEPMFVLLGRDPAGPTTIEFWANERNRLGKTKDPDDNARIGAALREADEMRTWRGKIMAHAEETGEQPAWRLPRPEEHGDDRPIRLEPPAPVPPNIWYGYDDPEHEHPITVRPLSFTRMSELLDYATAYGEFDENTPSGTQTINPHMSSPMNDMRRAAIWQLKRCMGIIGEDAEPPVADDTPPVPTVPVYVEGLFAVPGIDKPQSMEQIAAAYRKAAENITVDGVKIATVDSKPEDLAHAPEVPHHRFSVFHEAGDYAYARGLEVSPMHLATALDAMAKSGWHLCAIFGQTDAQHIGFIFRREVERFSAFELAHGFGDGFEDTRPRRDQGPVKWPADFKGTQERADCGGEGQEPCPEMGRGLEP